MEAQVDERKSAALAEANLRVEDGAQKVTTFAAAREMLRHTQVLQDGAGADEVDVGDPEQVPVFYLDGKPHKTRRAAIARFFTPRAISERYQAVMEATTDRLLADFRARGEARLDEISFELAVAVASKIVGLSQSDPHDMAPRIAVLLRASFNNAKGLARWKNLLLRSWYGYRFYVKDVRPAVRARREEPGEDIISQCLAKGYSDKAIMIECMTYATAGMVTTREFIVMVAWYMFERDELRADFLAADEDRQFAILLEILRLEPIAALLYRRSAQDLPETCLGALREGARFVVDMRAVNADEAAVGACPHALDPDRAKGQQGTFMSFGDGAHHCPGWQVALHETRIFIDRLLRVPGVAMVKPPEMLWNTPLMSYELRDAQVRCTP
ncbi:cytochrome P450 [Novosphingobium mangrovi (ex Hu et al. 2023)]|uniref:Cytochrome P450 n=1 Tax=Novosphingobium mangrovi (ex Hu et al. 2023) TaxID=2930094 RepID=A0ABT0AGQ3_9SPHN|nr:cytochrome P450 [Novosphingobium mangrovi (ex Hu et al. 2023)]MCJ1962373.1 cytochrome P450 [Novosphingobium mangrovi (ex Hu et al. 2023)]